MRGRDHLALPRSVPPTRSSTHLHTPTPTPIDLDLELDIHTYRPWAHLTDQNIEIIIFCLIILPAIVDHIIS